MSAIRLTIVGAAGRMGQELLQCIREDPRFAVSGLVVEPQSPLTGTPPPWPTSVNYLEDLDQAVIDADCILDFSAPQVIDTLARIVADRKLPLVCGTTGLAVAQLDTLRQAARLAPVFYSPNMSLGIQVMSRLVDLAVRLLGPDFDVEVTECHHRLKKDAPSGTALRLQQAIADARRTVPRALGSTELPETEPQIPVHALRGGDIPGDHTVHLMGLGERIEIIHRATSRRVFAIGALKVARWLVGRPPAFYTMADLFVA
ncbi:MAG: 4-hydroxy-tetrahydrodipicolinate reductase [Bradymonadales bacterium]|nr:4-hydroxy-tetrahydrodipicolinate reductase [Bradymonadales bacterium]